MTILFFDFFEILYFRDLDGFDDIIWSSYHYKTYCLSESSSWL